MTYEFEPWEIWNGGECPCPGEMVQVHLRSWTRQDAEESDVFDSWEWRHTNMSYDIIAFRRVKRIEG